VNATLNHHFEQLQEGTRILLKEVSTLSSSTYHHIPGEGKWSISQILTHILTAERLSILYLKKKSLGYKSFTNTGIVEELKFFILKVSQRIPLRYKAPRVVVENTPEALSYGDLVRQWESLRQDIRAFLETISDEDLRKKVYKHPRVGMLNVIHAVQFLREHIIHHHPQVTRIIKSVKNHKVNN
jgi:uncharacterized damage-inducible protein DinB